MTQQSTAIPVHPMQAAMKAKEDAVLNFFLKNLQFEIFQLPS